MRSPRLWMPFVLLCVTAGPLAGCGASQPAPAPEPAAAPVAGDHDHDHAEDHDHHHHEAPRGGTMIELGDHVGQLEFVLDRESGTLTAHFMDGHAEAPVRMTMPSLDLEVLSGEGAAPGALSLAASASPLTGETVGHTSEFAVTADWLKTTGGFTARTPALTVRGVAIEPVEFTFNPDTQP